jgi:hypothetical protein
MLDDEIWDERPDSRLNLEQTRLATGVWTSKNGVHNARTDIHLANEDQIIKPLVALGLITWDTSVGGIPWAL